MTKAILTATIFDVLRAALLVTVYGWFPMCAVLLVIGIRKNRNSANSYEDGTEYLFNGCLLLVIGLVVGGILWYNALPNGGDAR